MWRGRKRWSGSCVFSIYRATSSVRFNEANCLATIVSILLRSILQHRIVHTPVWYTRMTFSFRKILLARLGIRSVQIYTFYKTEECLFPTMEKWLNRVKNFIIHVGASCPAPTVRVISVSSSKYPEKPRHNIPESFSMSFSIAKRYSP